jgi:hypothetical protein
MTSTKNCQMQRTYRVWTEFTVIYQDVSGIEKTQVIQDRTWQPHEYTFYVYSTDLKPNPIEEPIIINNDQIIYSDNEWSTDESIVRRAKATCEMTGVPLDGISKLTSASVAEWVTDIILIKNRTTYGL